MYARSKKSLILSVLSLLLSIGTLWHSLPIATALQVFPSLGLLAVVNTLHGIFSIVLLLTAWVRPKQWLFSLGVALFTVVLALNILFTVTGQLVNSNNWWGLVVLGGLLSINVFALRAVLSETQKIP